MLKIFAAAVFGCLLLGVGAFMGESADSDITWIKDQQVPNAVVPSPAVGREGLILSYVAYPTDTSPYTLAFGYGNAVAGIALTLDGDCDVAQTLFTALNREVQTDGKISFVYNTTSNTIQDTYYTGAIAWVGYAFTLYRDQCNDSQFNDTIDSIANWVITMQDPATGSVRMGPDDTRYSTEHNLDAYFFLSNAGYPDEATKVKQSLLNNHWNTTHNCFQQGLTDTFKTLDGASWGALFLYDIGEVARAKSCLDLIDTSFLHTDTCTLDGTTRTISGHKSHRYAPTVWTEGSLGVAMAYERAGDLAGRDAILAEMEKARGETGGIVYACPAISNYSARESLTATAWLALVDSANSDKFWTTPDTSFTDPLTNYDSDRWLKAGVWSNGGVFANAWLPNHVLLDDEGMTLQLDDKNQSGGDCPNGCDDQPYASGAYRTTDHYGYGCFEARIKPIDQSGVVTSLFTYNDHNNKPPDGDGQFLHNEIDIEFVGKDMTGFQTNFYTQGWESNEYWVELGFDVSADFHNYGFKWTDDSIIWYVDGLPVHTVTNTGGISVPTVAEGGSQRIFMNAWPVTDNAGAEAWAGAFEYTKPLEAKYEWMRYEQGVDCTFTEPPAIRYEVFLPVVKLTD